MIVHARGYIFGHEVVWDDEAQICRYVDDGTPARGWGGTARPCPLCRELPTPEGYDPCLGYIPGALSVCCGHGVENPVITWEEGSPVRDTCESCKWWRRVTDTEGACELSLVATGKVIRPETSAYVVTKALEPAWLVTTKDHSCPQHEGRRDG